MLIPSVNYLLNTKTLWPFLFLSLIIFKIEIGVCLFVFIISLYLNFLILILTGLFKDENQIIKRAMITNSVV